MPTASFFYTFKSKKKDILKSPTGVGCILADTRKVGVSNTERERAASHNSTSGTHTSLSPFCALQPVMLATTASFTTMATCHILILGNQLAKPMGAYFSSFLLELPSEYIAQYPYWNYSCQLKLRVTLFLLISWMDVKERQLVGIFLFAPFDILEKQIRMLPHKITVCIKSSLSRWVPSSFRKANPTTAHWFQCLRPVKCGAIKHKCNTAPFFWSDIVLPQANYWGTHEQTKK